MRRLSYAIPCLIVAVAFYFAAAFGRDAVQILTSPVYGLDQTSFARAVHDLGGLADLGPRGLIRLAAFLGTIKLAVAVVFAIHVADRVRSLAGGTVNYDLLDAGVVLVVVSTFLSAAPALLEASPQFFNEHRPALWLAGLAATLGLAERIAATEDTPARSRAAGTRKRK